MGKRNDPEKIVLKKGPSNTNWWEKATFNKLKNNPTPWGNEAIVPVDKERGEIKVRITKEMLGKFDAKTSPQGRDIWKSFKKYEEIGPLAFAGIRHIMNISNFHDTRQVKNSFERLLTVLSLGLMIKIVYNKGKDFSYQTNYGHEIRYHSKSFQDVATRTLAALGFVCHVFPDNKPTAIWNTSTMGKFFGFVLSLCGTASHSESEIDGLKLIDYEGSQFLISSIEAMINIQRAILEKIEKDGYLDFYLSAEDDPRIINELYKSTHSGMYVFKKYQEKTTLDEIILGLVKNLDGKNIHIDCAYGSAYRTLTDFFKEIGFEDLIKKINWLHTEEKSDVGNIGKLMENPKNGNDEIFDMGADGTQVLERIMPDGKPLSYFPVLLSADYPEIFDKLPVGDVILHTDMDNDRLYVSQIMENNEQNKKLLKKIGVGYNVINLEKLVAVFIPNKFFHLLHEMNFNRLASLMKEGKINKDRTLVVLKTVASTPAVDEWAQKRHDEGFKVETINTPVGFAKLANIMYRAEGQMEKQKGEDIIINDAAGKKINIGKDPIIIAAWEESGGIIVGITYGFEDLFGKSFLAEREKSATESIFLSLALASKLLQEKKEINLANYLNELYERDDINAPIDIRLDNKLFTPSTSKESDKEEADGNKRKDRIFGAYVSLALSFIDGKLDITAARKILKDIFAEEYEARKSNPKSELKEVLMKRYLEADIDSLIDIKFTGDGVVFVFRKEGQNWSVLFRPSGTEPKLKSYGFGKDYQTLTTITWVFGFTENVKGELPESFKTNKVLMDFWGKDGRKAVDRARRMQSAWEDFGYVVDPEDKKDLVRLKITKAGLEKNRLIRSFNPPKNQLDLINSWLKKEGLKEIRIDVNKPKAMPQELIVELLQAIPDNVYKKLGRNKKEVLTKESS